MISLAYYLRVVAAIWMREAGAPAQAGAVGAGAGPRPALAGGAPEGDALGAAGPAAVGGRQHGVAAIPRAGVGVTATAVAVRRGHRFFGIVPQPLFDLVARAGEAFAGLWSRPAGASRAAPGPALRSAARMDFTRSSSSPTHERRRLRPHFTNLDRPVFALVNLPETVKGALFARYSRYQGTLRRLFLDEFATSLPGGAPAWEGDEGARAAALYERIFVGYGDDSVAQLGGAHVACEWVSNVITKVLQRPRLGAYLEQSTRYIPYDAPIDSPPRARLPLLPRAGPRARLRGGDGRAVRDLRRPAAARARRGSSATFPRRPRPPAARRARVQAKALDLLRGLLPGRLALAHGHLRDRPDLRAAHPAPARPPAAGGARLRARASSTRSAR